MKQGDLVTKQDLLNSDNALKNSMEHLEHKMLQMEYQMTIKLGTIVTIVMASATAVIKFL